MPQVTSAKLTANPAAEGRAWVQVYELEDETQTAERGRLFVVLSLNRETALKGTLLDSVMAGREIIGKLREEYFGNLTGGAFVVLQHAVEKVSKEFATTGVRLQIAAAACLGEVVYTAVVGGGQVSLLRNGMLVKILEGSSGKVSVASGYPLEADRLILATSEFFDLFSEGSIRAALTQGTPQASVEQLAPRLHSQDAPNVGGIILGFGSFQEDTPKAISFEEPKSTQSAPSETTPLIQRLTRRLSFQLPQKSIYVHPGVDEAGQSRRTAYTVGVLLLMLLIISIGFGIRQKRQNDYREQYAGKLATARHNFDEAQSLLTLNPTRARELYTLSSETVKQLSEQGVKDPALDELRQLLSDSEGKILGEYRASLDLFADLSLISDGFEGRDLAASGENIYALDPQGKIMKVMLKSKKSQVIAGPEEVGQATQLAAYADRAFFVKEDGIYEVDEDGVRVKKDWEGEVLVHAYTGNLYVLDKAKSTIKRFVGGATGFSTGQSWLGAGINLDLGQSVGWTIDGSVWVISSTGKITRLTQGVPQAFSPDPVLPQLTPSAIYTNEDLAGLYVLDPNNLRIVVFDKEGRLLGQYKNEGLINASDLVVSEEEKKAIVLVKEKLLAIELKHL